MAEHTKNEASLTLDFESHLSLAELDYVKYVFYDFHADKSSINRVF
jgi:hypothetical protein